MKERKRKEVNKLVATTFLPRSSLSPFLLLSLASPLTSMGNLPRRQVGCFSHLEYNQDLVFDIFGNLCYQLQERKGQPKRPTPSSNLFDNEISIDYTEVRREMIRAEKVQEHTQLHMRRCHLE